MKPLFVYVMSSEDQGFNDLHQKVIPFDQFENMGKTLSENLRLGNTRYCCKTDIQVLFDDGSSYSCRIDFDPELSSFRQRSENMIAYWEKQPEGSFMKKGYASAVAILKKIDFGA